MKKAYRFATLTILISLFSCTNTPSTTAKQERDSTNKIRLADKSEFNFSDFYRNESAKLFFFKLNFKFENVREQNEIDFPVKTPIDELGNDYSVVGGWISGNTTNDEDNWDFRLNYVDNNRLHILGFNKELSHSEPHTLEGHVGIVVAYRENNNALVSSKDANCEVVYFCGKKLGSLSKHNITIDGKKYTYRVNDIDITKEKVVEYVKSVCLAGNIDIETGLSEGWEFDCN